MVEIFVHKATELDTTTLAASTALLFATLLGTADRNFMFKNVRTEFHISWETLDDKMMILLANMDATVAQLAEAMATTETDIEDSVNYRTGQDRVRRVWDFFVPTVHAEDLTTVHQQFSHQWKLPPKGIPVLRGGGLALFAWNMDSTQPFTNGPTLNATTKSMGGWF